MPTIEFTQAQIDQFSKGAESFRFHKECCDSVEKMAIHADGVYPKCLIEERRPNEPEEVKCYREKIWEPVTKPIFSKIFSSLQKIRRSSDWLIKYPDEEEFPKINEEETLERYCEQDFPYFKSMTTWVFEVLLRKYLIDANGVVAIIPMNTPDSNEYLKPVPITFSSKQIIDYRAEDYAALKIDDSSWYLFTTMAVYKYEKIKNGYEVANTYAHGLGILPVTQWKGAMVDHCDHHLFYESRIAGIIPELNEAVREYSDLQAAKVLHIYPERWEYTNNECLNCKGTGVRQNPEWCEGAKCEPTCSCDTCKGRGYIAAGPYSKIIVKPSASNMGESQIPTPPAGYVQKDIDIVKLQEESVEAHKYKALAAVNYEFLAQVPLATSGVSKAQDRDEANNTTHSVAEDIVQLMDWAYKVIAKYRYSGLYNDVQEMLPYIAVPEKFDLVSAAAIGEELKLAKDSKANPIIVNAMEMDYTAKKFANEPELKDMISLIIKLDPLAGVSEDDKMIRLSNKGISQLTYIISSNIQEFVQDAIEKDKDFAEKPLKAQKDVIKKMAEPLITPVQNSILDEGDTTGANPIGGQVQANDPRQSAQNPGGGAGQVTAA